MSKVETKTARIIDRLIADGWTIEGGSKHTKLSHPGRAEKIMVPRHRTLTEGVARQIARAAGWIQEQPMTHYVAFLDGADGKVGAWVPDCVGCTAMGKTVDEAIANITEALREWMADYVADGRARPVARGLKALRDDPASDAETAWSTVQIPMLLDAGRTVRANISIDAGLLEQIDEAAKLRGLTRSAFLASAAREKIVEQR